MPVTVSLVEDNPELRASLVALLNGAPGLHCVSAHGSAEDALENLPRVKPDVALVDLNLPGMDGIECVIKLKAALPGVQVLMLSMYQQSDLIFNSLRAGASGYLLKSRPATELIQAIEQVHAGGAPMSMSVARKVIDHFQKDRRPPGQKLTSREREILELLVKGYFYREIGEVLDLSPATVRTHLHSIYVKLHVRSRSEAIGKFLAPETT